MSKRDRDGGSGSTILHVVSRNQVCPEEAGGRCESQFCQDRCCVIVSCSPIRFDGAIINSTIIFGLFHNCIGQSRYSEVNVHLFERCGRTSWLSSHNGSPRSIMIWICVWFCWLGTQCLSNNFSTNSFTQSCLKDIFGGSRGDAYTFSYMTSPVSIRTTFAIQ